VSERGRHLLLYDGVCGLCDRLVQTVLVRDRREAFHFAPLQCPAASAALERFGRDSRDLNTLYVVADYQTAAPRLLSKSRAALFVAGTLGWPWKATIVLSVLPRGLLDWGYDLIARYRYRLFGRFDQCVIPLPEHRARFVESIEAARSKSGETPA
jgi:predicted DCC family thiol-disulfide oxidoreductase YuxK